MINNDFDPENQCELSYELLYLLKWLVDHEEPALKKIVARAVQKGFNHAMPRTADELTDHTKTAVQTSILDFLDLLDTLLCEALHESSVFKAYQRNLIPSLHKIDGHICDRGTLQSTLEKTTEHLEDYPEANAREQLFKELLKQWKPNNQKFD